MTEEKNLLEDFQYVEVRLRFKALQFRWSDLRKNHSLLELLWGCDVFYDNVPMFKTLILANVIVWVILFIG